jgi:hypothetical protein
MNIKTKKEILDEINNSLIEVYPDGYITEDEFEKWLKAKKIDNISVVIEKNTDKEYSELENRYDILYRKYCRLLDINDELAKKTEIYEEYLYYIKETLSDMDKDVNEVNDEYGK